MDRHDLAVLDGLQDTFCILTTVTDAPDPTAPVHAADQWDSRYNELDQVWSGNPNAALVAELAGSPTGTALDIGCGEGADAIWLAGQGWQVTAIDVSAVAIGRARQAGSAARVVVDWQVTSLARMPFDTRPFDLVTAFYPTLVKAGGEDLDRLLSSVAVNGTLLFVHHADIDRERALAQGFDPDDFLGVDDVATALGEKEWDIAVHESRERDVHGGAGAHHHHDLVLRARRLAQRPPEPVG